MRGGKFVYQEGEGIDVGSEMVRRTETCEVQCVRMNL